MKRLILLALLTTPAWAQYSGPGLPIQPCTEKQNPSNRWTDSNTGLQYVCSYVANLNGYFWNTTSPFFGYISGGTAITPNVQGSAVQDKGGQVFNVYAYGAKGNATTCDDPAFQSACNASGGAVVDVPTGKFLLCQPIEMYSIGNAAGCKFRGKGYGKSQVLLSQSFTVPATATFGGITVPVASAAFDIQGMLSPTHIGAFQFGTEIAGLEITPLGCEANPGVGEPACTRLSIPVKGISVEGCWHCLFHDNWITFMTDDGLTVPYRSDIGTDPDWWATAYADIYQNHFVQNEGWAVNLDGFDGATDITVNLNEMTTNWLGGVRDTGWANRITNNGIGTNGCGPAIAGTSSSHITCPTAPPGPGILIDRADGGGGPLKGVITGNALDSNAGGHILNKAGVKYKIEDNLLVTHTTGYVFNDTYPGAQNIPKTAILLGSGTGAVNTTINENQQRSDFQCAAGYPTPSAGCAGGNVLMDPEIQSINLGSSSDQSGNLINQNLFRGYTNSYNYQPYTLGGGAVAGYPVMGGGGTTVSSWSLLDGGYGIATPPTITVWGGDSAWLSPTLVTLTQSGGALNGCSILQAGGPYNRAPATAVSDNANFPGTGGTFSVTLNGSGVPTSCAITAGGSGYSAPQGGVAPQCATPPVIAAVSSIGLDYITVTNGGNYGSWTPGATAPTVTATINDATGTGYSVAAAVRPVNTNTNPLTAPTVQWEVVGVHVLARGYGSTAPTVAFSSASTITPATATATVAHVLSLPLTVSNAGSCDAGAALGLVMQYASYPVSNINFNQISENNQPVSSTSYAASLTTTAATSDSVTVTGMTSSGHCSLTPTNSSAATNVATTYISAKALNKITVTHTATSGMTYDVRCSNN